MIFLASLVNASTSYFLKALPVDSVCTRHNECSSHCCLPYVDANGHAKDDANGFPIREC